MTIYFNRSTEDEISLECSDMYESLNLEEAALTVMYKCVVTPETVFESFSALQNLEFDTVEIVNGEGVEIPLNGNYSRVQSVNIAYNDGMKSYSVNMSIR